MAIEVSLFRLLLPYLYLGNYGHAYFKPYYVAKEDSQAELSGWKIKRLMTGSQYGYTFLSSFSLGTKSPRVVVKDSPEQSLIITLPALKMSSPEAFVPKGMEYEC